MPCIINDVTDLTGQWETQPQAASWQTFYDVSLEGLFVTGSQASGFWELFPHMPDHDSYRLTGDCVPLKLSDGTAWELSTNTLPGGAKRDHSAALTLPMDLALLAVTVDNLFQRSTCLVPAQ